MVDKYVAEENAINKGLYVIIRSNILSKLTTTKNNIHTNNTHIFYINKRGKLLR